jgi:cation diffusion facilitator CzcD-associated flavoprotein CzcO
MSDAGQMRAAAQPSSAGVPDHDAIVIGAGIAGMYALHRLRELGLSTRVIEVGSDVGGTWYWNRYPGARFDSESYSYGFSFSEELLQEWDWSEHFASQPETLRYLNHVADRFDLRRDIEFNRRVVAARYDAGLTGWRVRLDDGRTFSCRFLITAVGPLSAPVLPSYPGMEEFEGEAYHTGLWPQDRTVTFEGKKVAVIGTGSTGVQVIQEAAKTALSLTVFQRNPNWCAPLHNRPISVDEMAAIKANYPNIFARCAESPGAFLHKPDLRYTFDVDEVEREALYEKLYGEPGFGIWLSTFRDVLMEQRANDTLSAFVARKIRERVKDPQMAEKLIPKNHGFGTRRVALETRYFEVYNQDNVALVDLKAEPIEAMDSAGIRTARARHDFDMIVYATGFDAVLGSLNRIDIRGEHGVALKDEWRDGPTTFLGMMSSGFPNMFMVVGPHNAGIICNLPRCIEQNVDWIASLIGHMRDGHRSRVEARAEAQERWIALVQEAADRLLMSKTDSWFTGVNSNLPGRDRRIPLVYAGGAPKYREICEGVAAGGYAELRFD